MNGLEQHSRHNHHHHGSFSHLRNATNATLDLNANITGSILQGPPYVVSAGEPTNATDPIQTDGLVHNADGSRSFPDGTGVGGVNDVWRYAVQREKHGKRNKKIKRYAYKARKQRGHDWDENMENNTDVPTYTEDSPAGYTESLNQKFMVNNRVGTNFMLKNKHNYMYNMAQAR